MDHRMDSGVMEQARGTVEDGACLYFCFRFSWQFRKWVKGQGAGRAGAGWG